MISNKRAIPCMKKEVVGGATYPSYEEYHVPPPTMHKMVDYPPLQYDPPSDVEDDHSQHDMAVNDRRWNHRDDDGNHGWYGTRHANNNHVEISKNNKYHGGILRPPLGSVNRHPSHQYHQQHAVIDAEQEVRRQQGWRYGEASRVNHNNNRAMEDCSKKYPNYGEVSRLEDDYVLGGKGDEEMESLIERMQRSGMVKKIEVIEYERKTYRGGRQEWRVLSGSGAPKIHNYSTTNNNQYLANGYPNNKAPWVKGF